MTQGPQLFEHYIDGGYLLRKAATALGRMPRSVRALTAAECTTLEAHLASDTAGDSLHIGLTNRQVRVEAAEQVAKLRVMKGG